MPLLYADKAGFNSVMYIQNGGLECSSIEIWFKAQDDCLRARICEIFTLAPGETYQFDASDCVGPDWQGSAWLRSTQPLGIAVDIIGRDVLMTYTGEPAAFAYDPDATGLKPGDAVFTMGDQVAFGPLMYSEYQGWDTGVQVQNLSPVVNAKVKVYFLDRSGDIITTLVDWICPRGSQTFFLPVIADLPGNWVGSIRVESQEWWTPGGQRGTAGHRGRGDVDQVQRRGPQPDHRGHRLQPAAGAQDLPLADRQWRRRNVQWCGVDRDPEPAEGPGRHGRDQRGGDRQHHPEPGFTDFAIFIYDQNGLLDYICEKLNEKQVEYVSLEHRLRGPGFKGHAIIARAGA